MHIYVKWWNSISLQESIIFSIVLNLVYTLSYHHHSIHHQQLSQTLFLLEYTSAEHCHYRGRVYQAAIYHYSSQGTRKLLQSIYSAIRNPLFTYAINKKYGWESSNAHKQINFIDFSIRTDSFFCSKSEELPIFV